MTDHALLLVNLGSPASTSVADVRSYLNQFLMDPYVIDLPWPVRRLLVSLILIKRPEQSAHAYASIWWEEGSPLVELSRRLQKAMTKEWTQGPVELAMRYGEPSIETVLTRLAAQGIKKVTLAPLYPQFADSTVTTVIEEAKRVVKSKKAACSVLHRAAVLRSARVSRCIGRQRQATSGTGLRPSAAEFSRPARAAFAQAGPDRQPLLQE
jgi:ferrochelatase